MGDVLEIAGHSGITLGETAVTVDSYHGLEINVFLCNLKSTSMTGKPWLDQKRCWRKGNCILFTLVWCRDLTRKVEIWTKGWWVESSMSVGAVKGLQTTHVTLLDRCHGHPKWWRESYVTVIYISRNLSKLCCIFWNYHQILASFNIVCITGYSVLLPQMIDSLDGNTPLCSKCILLKITGDVFNKSSLNLICLCTW